MIKKKACKKCRIFITGEECPLCKGNQFTHTWNGRIIFLDVTNSLIAKKTGATENGEYAIKVK